MGNVSSHSRQSPAAGGHAVHRKLSAVSVRDEAAPPSVCSMHHPVPLPAAALSVWSGPDHRSNSNSSLLYAEEEPEGGLLVLTKAQHAAGWLP